MTLIQFKKNKYIKWLGKRRFYNNKWDILLCGMILSGIHCINTSGWTNNTYNT